MTLKLTLKAARANVNLTQKELAKLMGVSEQTIIKWEKGDGKNIKLGDFENLCEILKVDTHQIIFYNHN